MRMAQSKGCCWETSVLGGIALLSLLTYHGVYLQLAIFGLEMNYVRLQYGR